MLSQKRLEKAFPGKGKALRAILAGESLEGFKSVQDLRRQCYNTPSPRYQKMTALNEVLGGFGIAHISRDDCKRAADYINLGDTYTETLLFDFHACAYRLTTWGDFVEHFARRVS